MGTTIRTLPPACRGLRPLDLQRAAIIAIDEFAGPRPKARHRHLAAIAGARLRRLIGTRVPPSPRPKPNTAAAAPTGWLVPVGLAALAAWLVTVASGGYLLAGWIRSGGLRRGNARRPPPVILSHFGLATTGLICWVGYLISGLAPVAWLAVGLLLPVAGLGLATLMLAIPDSASAQRSRMPVVAISAHGILATVTMLLVLLAAIAAR